MKKIVVIGGGGHVGLPLSLVLASRGFTVTALDISIETVNKINDGQMPFQESGAIDLLTSTLADGSFCASADPSIVSSADTVIIVIGTPVDEHLNPDPNAVNDAIKECLPFMNSSQLVILRSTVFPGVTRRVRELFLSVGLEPEVTFCPERILEGHAIKELTELPQIIGSWSEEGFSRASVIFEKLGVKCISVSPDEAELAKLFTNVWRYIKFAAANQFWLMSSQAGLDYSRIRSAIVEDYPRASDLPGAGFSAGPCLFKDTMQLAAFSINNFALGHSAMQVNEGIPLYIVSELEKKYKLSELTIGILGAAFKADSDDIRSSLAYKLKKALEFKARKVMITDPYVSVDRSLSSFESTITDADILIIASPHGEYRNIKSNKPIVDIWNLLGNGSLIP